MQPLADAVAAAAKMAPTPSMIDLSHSLTVTDAAAIDHNSSAGIAQAVVALLTPTLAATVDTAMQRGLEQLHLEFHAQAQWIIHAEERISSLEDDTTAYSAVLAQLSNSNRDLWDKLDDL